MEILDIFKILGGSVKILLIYKIYTFYDHPKDISIVNKCKAFHNTIIEGFMKFEV